MKKYFAYSLLLIATSIRLVIGQVNDIRINSIGYLPDMQKEATIIKKCSDFSVIDAKSKKIIFTGKVKGPFYHDSLKQNGWIADFSKVKKEGHYYLDVPGIGKSIVFEIGNNIYDSVYYTVMRAFYLWRCGTEVKGIHNGQTFVQKACHLNDGYLDYLGKKDSIMDGTMGWHDAGDYGKYTVNAGITVANLLYGWNHFKNNIANYSLNLPETAPGYPDFLKEIKWETDWLLKMQYPDGSGRISHKLTTLNFCGFIPPDEEKEKRFFSEWSSAATANFAATMAMASRYFREYDSAYADICLSAAERSYSYLKNNPQEKFFIQGDFRTGYYNSKDYDDRLWASAELWETTGKQTYLKDFEDKALLLSKKIDKDWDWGNVKNMSMFTYMLSEKTEKNKNLLTEIKSQLIATADSFIEVANNDIYHRIIGDRYYWGCNGEVVRQAVNFQICYLLTGDKKYLQAIIDGLNYTLGRNYYGRSFVTGIGFMPPMFPHDRRSASDNNVDPWPGYIIGGGTTATNWQDDETDFRTNEIAINWQAALVYAVACFVNYK